MAAIPFEKKKGGRSARRHSACPSPTLRPRRSGGDRGRAPCKNPNPNPARGVASGKLFVLWATPESFFRVRRAGRRVRSPGHRGAKPRPGGGFGTIYAPFAPKANLPRSRRSFTSRGAFSSTRATKACPDRILSACAYDLKIAKITPRQCKTAFSTPPLGVRRSA